MGTRDKTRIQISRHAVERFQERGGRWVAGHTAWRTLWSYLYEAVVVRFRDPFRARLDEARFDLVPTYAWCRGWLLVIRDGTLVTVWRRPLRGLIPVSLSSRARRSR
ncbi:MAG: hypothetical protein JKY65_06045 [Planctomycetes bacterium]|nr:hypothetical protein [Planctomycetota bacterium]